MSSSEGEPKWYALRCQTKREALAAASLREMDLHGEIEVFLPRIRYQKATKRGQVWWVEPLFPGYLLARFDLTLSGRQVTSARGVSRIIGFGTHTPDVPASFVETLKTEVERHQEGVGEITLSQQVRPGDEVELATGAFQGQEGVVLQVRPGTERVQMLIEFMGGVKPVEVSLYDLILERPTAPKGLGKE